MFKVATILAAKSINLDGLVHDNKVDPRWVVITTG